MTHSRIHPPMHHPHTPSFNKWWTSAGQSVRDTLQWNRRRRVTIEYVRDERDFKVAYSDEDGQIPGVSSSPMQKVKRKPRLALFAKDHTR